MHVSPAACASLIVLEARPACTAPACLPQPAAGLTNSELCEVPANRGSQIVLDVCLCRPAALVLKQAAGQVSTESHPHVRLNGWVAALQHARRQ